METQTIDNNLIKAQGSVTAYVPKEQFEALSNKQKSDNNLLFTIMGAIVIFIVITFWIELSAMHRNYEQDKSIMLQNNQLNKDYFDKVLFLNNEIQKLNIDLEVTKAKNYLK